MLKKGFTLVELLIVIVVITILTTITFRLMGLSKEKGDVSETVKRLHALESAIGGYYAAFGSYPPVRLHGSRNIFYPVNGQGIQLVNESPDEGVLDWIRVRAACRSQPVEMLYPFGEYNRGGVEELSLRVQALAKQEGSEGLVSEAEAVTAGFDALNTPSQLMSRGKDKEVEWTKCNLFKFGLMSFLLPRFLFMMQYPDTSIYEDFVQWGDNNNVPCKFETGLPYDSWERLAADVVPVVRDGWKPEWNPQAWRVALLPSQIVTARWVACLEKICVFNYETSWPTNMWGVQLQDPKGDSPLSVPGITAEVNFPWRTIPVFTSGAIASGAKLTQAFALDGVTVKDGWGEDFYYYSPPPHQGYRLWSGGYDKTLEGQKEQYATFPPWISEAEIDKILSPEDAKRVRKWKANDIVHMSMSN